MKTENWVGGSLLLGAMLLFISQGDHHIGPVLTKQEGVSAQLATIRNWDATPRLAANLMIEKYGPPQRIYEKKLIWDAHWPWKRISVDADRPDRPLEQVVDYYVPDSKLVALSQFPHGLVVFANAGELGARSDRVELNRLTLNLAHDIITGKRTVEQANRFYANTVELSVAGKSSPYLHKLLFEVPPEDRLELLR